jgi:membrane-bound lytic murein transglycosylase D
MSFQVIADVLQMSVEDLRSYNPELKADVIPKRIGGYWLNIPEEKVSMFYQCEEDIQEITKLENLATEERKAAEPKIIYHTVRKGECLPIIARKYGVSVANLKSWNNIRGSLIYPNQKLKIYR